MSGNTTGEDVHDDVGEGKFNSLGKNAEAPVHRAEI
jgi:hypothetical protein